MKKITTFWALNQWKVTMAALLVAIAVPLVVDDSYVLNILTLCFMYTTLSVSLNLVTGFMGQLTLGHAAFFGVGAYTAAILATRFEMNFLVTVVVAAVASALVGMLLSLPIMRLSGRYLAIVTLAFCEIMRLVELNWTSLTGGPMGISGIKAPNIFGFVFKTAQSKYYLIMGIAIISLLIVSNLMNSRLGRGISAIKGDEIAASAMGINLFRYKVMCFAVSSAIAGLAGAFFAHYMRYIDPTSFGFDQSVQILGMSILGGLGSIPGSVVGSFILTAIPEFLRDLMEYRQIIYGLILAVLVIVKPTGMLGSTNLKYIRQRYYFAKKKGEGEQNGTVEGK